VLPPGKFNLSLQLDWANTFDKWRRSVAGGSNRGRFDLEMVRPSAAGRVGLPFGIEIGLEVPIVILTGGIADGLIQGWHGLFGLENGGRQKVPNGAFLLDVGVPGIAEWKQTRPSGPRLGDITVDLRIQLLPPSRQVPGVVGSVLLKAPTGSPDHGAGSGAFDVAAAVAVEHGIGPVAVYGMVAVTAFGRTGFLGDLLYPAAVTGAFAVELVLTPHWSLVVQLRGSSPFHHSFIHPWMNRGPLGLTIGSRLHFGGLDLSIGLEQDVIVNDPSSDVALILEASITTP